MNIKEKIKDNISLALYSTFKIGGKAKYFIEIKDEEELPLLFDWIKESKINFFILGGGSNLLINDKGVDGLVIKLSNTKIDIKGIRLECGAGATLNQILSIAIKNSLTGLEWAIGIPQATIGGAIRGNAGAFGSETSDIVETVEVFNVKNHAYQIYSNKDCEFNYRRSIFVDDNDLIAWKTVLKFTKDKQGNINKKVEEILGFREEHQPRLPSAGSIFKNIQYDYLKSKNPSLADHAKESGAIKDGMLGAGWLIDFAGLKGKTIGGAKVSLEHANFIVNTGKATASEIIMLISYLKQQIRDRYKVQLQEEIKYLGF